MYATVTQPLTFEEFLAWNDGSGREFELLDGIPVPLSKPNSNHGIELGRGGVLSPAPPN